MAILILIKSATGNYKKRELLRSTWANRTYLSRLRFPIEFAFLVGVGQFEKAGSIPMELKQETEDHNDMVWMEHVDTYRNNTYKTLGGMKWAAEYCPNFEFAMTVDDDMYLSTGNVIKFLRNPMAYPREGSITGTPCEFSQFGFAINPNELFYAGTVMGGDIWLPERKDQNHFCLKTISKIVRLMMVITSDHFAGLGRSKNVITFSDYPFSKFPFYPTGAAVIYSRQAIKYIYIAAPFVKFLSIDDVYVGIVAAKLEIPLVDLRDWIAFAAFNKWKNGCANRVKTRDCNETVIAIHWCGMEESLREFWKKYN